MIFTTQTPAAAAVAIDAAKAGCRFYRIQRYGKLVNYLVNGNGKIWASTIPLLFMCVEKVSENRTKIFIIYIER